MIRRSWMGMAALAVFFTPVVVLAQEKKAETPVQDPNKPVTIISPAPQKEEKKAQPRLTGQKAEDAKTLLEAKRLEAKELGDRATHVTKEMGKLASSGKLPQDEEALKLMKSMVEELQQINERLTKIESDIAGIQGWMEGMNESYPIVLSDIGDLKRSKWGNYVQFQYRDTDQLGGQTDAFVLRRIRLGLTQTIDPKTSIKVSFDLAQNATGLANNTGAQLRDAILTYDIEPSDVTVGTQLAMGQQALPLGYELERSSSDREFPERAIYNQENFPGERGRGVQIRKGVGTNGMVHLGVWNALTFNDAEQRSVTGSPANRLGVSAGYRIAGANYELGISGFFAERPGYQVGYLSPGGGGGPTGSRIFGDDVKRQFIFLDGGYVGLFNPNIWIRGEVMWGKDRPTLPLAANSTGSGGANSGTVDPAAVGAAFDQKDRLGFHIVLGYNINYRNQISFKYEQYDQDTDNNGDLVEGYGVAYNYFINPNARLTLAHEIFEDNRRGTFAVVEPGPIGPARQQKRYGVTTLRMQFKF